MEAAEQAVAKPTTGQILSGLAPPGILVRPEEPDDVAAVDAMVVRTFGQPVLDYLLADLRSSSAWVAGLSFVAVTADRLVGHVLFTRSLLDAPRRLVDVLVLSPLAVAPEWQRRGIGSALVRHGLAEIQRRKEPLVFLEGSPSFYPRLGFESAVDLEFRRPSLRIPKTAFQVHRGDSYEPWMTGTLVYADPFWRHDCVGLRD